MPTLLFAVTIDTECDRSPTWRASNPLTFHSVVEGIPGRLQPLFRRYAVKPTYLISSEVLEDDASVSVLHSLKSEEAELGTHLHGAHIEPERRWQDLAGTEAPEFQCQYPEEIEAAKLRNLTHLFRTRLNREPTAFRAGRFGASARTLKLLAPLGYRVDSSVTPHILWDGQVDFRNAPEQPYYPDETNLVARGSTPILEVPVTIEVVRHLAVFRRLVWLRPSLASAHQMISLVDTVLNRFKYLPIVVLNMMFHSMEIIPNASPYTRTESECADLHIRIEQVLQHFERCHAKCTSLSELREYF